MAKAINKAIEEDARTRRCLHRRLESKQLHEPQTPLHPPVTAYLVINWVLEAKNESHGFGFPFDRPHLDFYRRLQDAYPKLKALKQTMAAGGSLLPLMPISKTLADHPEQLSANAA